MTDLIKRLENATEGSREFDVEIFRLCNKVIEKSFHDADSLAWMTEGDDFICWANVAEDSHQILPYTTSIDAALELMLEEEWWCLSGPHSVSGGRYSGGSRRYDATLGTPIEG